jgi:hypothetical protein
MHHVHTVNKLPGSVYVSLPNVLFALREALIGGARGCCAGRRAAGSPALLPPQKPPKRPQMVPRMYLEQAVFLF